MFTFGREKEIKHAICFIGNEEKALMLINVINGVHDYLEGIIKPQDLIPIIIKSFSEGKSGVWESTGSWLRKLCFEDHSFEIAWETLANNNLSNVRFRAACFLDEMPNSTREKVSIILLQDKSKKVREMAEDRVNEKSSQQGR